MEPAWRRTTHGHVTEIQVRLRRGPDTTVARARVRVEQRDDGWRFELGVPGLTLLHGFEEGDPFATMREAKEAAVSLGTWIGTRPGCWEPQQPEAAEG